MELTNLINGKYRYMQIMLNNVRHDEIHYNLEVIFHMKTLR